MLRRRARDLGNILDGEGSQAIAIQRGDGERRADGGFAGEAVGVGRQQATLHVVSAEDDPERRVEAFNGREADTDPDGHLRRRQT